MNYDNLHPLQMLILKKMMSLSQARFRDLKISGFSSDHLAYHVKGLVENGIMLKCAGGEYILTDQGKEYVGRIDERTAIIETQGKRGVLVRVTKQEGRKRMYLVNKRLKHPFLEYVGFHTGKIKEGESIFSAARRELAEETGLAADLHFVAIFHYLDFKENGDLLRDIYFHVFNAFHPTGDLITYNPEEGVENFWITEADLKNEKTFPGFWHKPMFLNKRNRQFADTDEVYFREKVRIVKEY